MFELLAAKAVVSKIYNIYLSSKAHVVVYLEYFPDEVRKVEENSLQKEDEGNPLVVRVVHLESIE